MQATAKETNLEAVIDPAVDDLNRIVVQAEELLRSLGEGGGEAAEAVRNRVTETLEQARARLAATAHDAEKVAESIADRADKYVHENPWQSIAIAALLGSVLTLIAAKTTQRT
jgi:ElaB/YqjD/DUF883 family membrane-anchored ribosome-binding protein